MLKGIRRTRGKINNLNHIRLQKKAMKIFSGAKIKDSF
jgi:hypothetical protein